MYIFGYIIIMLITFFMSFCGLLKLKEKQTSDSNHNTFDYSMATILSLIISIFWPIALPTIILVFLLGWVSKNIYEGYINDY